MDYDKARQVIKKKKKIQILKRYGGICTFERDHTNCSF